MSDDTRSIDSMDTEHHDGHTSTAVEPAGHGGELATKFANPGLPEHRYRHSDVDPKAAKRREREVATLFGLSTIGTIVFIVGYLAIHLNSVDDVRRSNLVLGVGLGIALFCVGAGAIHWAKTLMPDDEIVSERHTMRSSDEDRAAAIESMKEGAGGAGLGRRKLIRNSLLGALGPLGLLAILPLRDLGPLPGDWFSHTFWKQGMRLMTDPQARPIRPSDVPIGGVVHVLPEGINDVPDSLEQKVKAAVILIRLAPQQMTRRADPHGWAYDGIVAYSIICTHVGCPVGLYEQKSHRLLCPCHQSTFDVLDHCKVVFGPANRPLPQLPITVNDEGYLVAQSDFHEPVGPSFWERG